MEGRLLLLPTPVVTLEGTIPPGGLPRRTARSHLPSSASLVSWPLLWGLFPLTSLSLSLSVSLSPCLSVYPCVCLLLFQCLSVPLNAYLSLSDALFLFLSLCVSLSLSLYLSFSFSLSKCSPVSFYVMLCLSVFTLSLQHTSLLSLSIY